MVKPRGFWIKGLALALVAGAQSAVAQENDAAPIGGFGARLAYNSNLGAVAGVDFVSEKVFGRDHQLALSAQVSQSDRRLSFDYRIPTLSGENPEWGLSLFRNDTRAITAYNFDTLSYGVRPSWTRKLSDNAQFAVFADMSVDEITNLAAGSSALIVNDLGQRTKTGMTVKYTWQDSAPEGGTVLRLSTGIAATSDNRAFLKTEASFFKNWSAQDGNFLLTSGLNMGHMAMQSGASHIGDRFFLGAGQMRGFDLAGLGPRDLMAGNAALGGNSYGALKLDLRFPKAVPNQTIFVPGLFVDIGSVWGLDNTNGGATGADIVDDQQSLRSVIGLSAQINFGKAGLNIYASRPLQKQSYDIESQFQVSLATQF